MSTVKWDEYVFHQNVLPRVEWLSAGALIVQEYGCSWEEASRQLTATGVKDSQVYRCPQCTGPVKKTLVDMNHDCEWCGNPLRSVRPTFIIEHIPPPATSRSCYASWRGLICRRFPW
jgi:uncharacterized protein with PIN domain